MNNADILKPLFLIWAMVIMLVSCQDPKLLSPAKAVKDQTLLNPPLPDQPSKPQLEPVVVKADTTQVSEDTAESVEPVSEPVADAAESVEPVSEPVADAAESVEPVSEPVADAAESVEPVSEPVAKQATLIKPHNPIEPPKPVASKDVQAPVVIPPPALAVTGAPLNINDVSGNHKTQPQQQIGKGLSGLKEALLTIGSSVVGPPTLLVQPMKSQALQEAQIAGEHTFKVIVRHNPAATSGGSSEMPTDSQKTSSATSDKTSTPLSQSDTHLRKSHPSHLP